jgi:hypothetical protein
MDVFTDSNGDLTSDADALYWVSDDKLLRLPFDTGHVTRLVTGLGSDAVVAVRGDSAYVAERGGRILRVPIDGSAHRPSRPITGPCPTPLGSVEDLALSPRDQPDLELLALRLEPERVTASQATYERVVADVAALRALAPRLVDNWLTPFEDGTRLTIAFDHIAAQSLEEGQYSAWNCLNEFYGASTPTVSGAMKSAWATLKLRGTYNLPLIAELYRQLPGVTSAGPEESNFMRTTCVARDGDHIEYVLYQGIGDCPSGCTEHRYIRFASDVAGQVTQLDDWSSVGNEAPPDWVGRVCGR